MSQHNIIGSEAFDGRPYIIVRKVPVGINRRRRRNTMMTVAVAIIALIVGALVAVFALTPILMDRGNAAVPTARGHVQVAPSKPVAATTTASATGGPAVTATP
ncbi:MULTISPECIES: hypothetical protein [Brevundimonas]|uniref:hypothetical protein n=1 Tax=Brevundimonas pishanensis TaxID=2896315 RepID=UPI001FA7CA11|nr:hypothetical protein [Brevundimonas pishanensis]